MAETTPPRDERPVQCTLPESLHRKAKAEAALTGKILQAWLADLVAANVGYKPRRKL